MQLGRTRGTEGAVGGGGGGRWVLYPPPPPPPVNSGLCRKICVFHLYTGLARNIFNSVSLAFYLLYSIFYVYFKDGRIVTVLLDSAK